MRSDNVKNFRAHGFQKQGGVVLIVGLIMVLLITIVGLSAVRSSGLQEAMAGNMRDRNLALQAAESGLREAEEILAPTNTSLPPFNGTNGLHEDLSSTPANTVWYFTDADWANPAITQQIDFDLPNVTARPVYVIEELQVDIGSNAAAEGSAIDLGGIQTTGDATPYRISSRGVGATNDTEVVLQSTYNRRFQ